MWFFGSLFDKPTSALHRQTLDEDTGRLLLSAAGCVGGGVCDILLEYTQSEEARFFIMVETGFFGVGVASYFFVVRYSNTANPSDFANALLDDYRAAYIDSHNQSLTAEERNSLDQFLQREGPPAVEDYTRALIVSAGSPWVGLDGVITLLVSRLRDRGGVVLPDQAPRRLRNNIEIASQALMRSYEHFLG